jgi:D-alanyl-D-alanine carboxypeptidase/D-alanyl-D-alanine-endopeptidase (penicillin-binding protein 4)
MNRMLSIVLIGSFYTLYSYASVSVGIDNLINQIDETLTIGVNITDLNTGVTIYQHNPHHPFIPASNMKLFSNAAALMVLGPDYRFENKLSIYGGRIQKGILTGMLYLHLPGDPSFTQKQLDRLISTLKNWHITCINGNVVIDSSHTTLSPYAPGWLIEDLAYDYGAPLAPVMIDANRMLITINPANHVGLPAIVEVDDNSASILIDNQVRTQNNSSHCGITLVMTQKNHLLIRGCVNVAQGAIQQKIAIRNPLLYAQGLIKQQLAQQHISLKGEIVLGHTPSGAMLIATTSSKSIAQLMADTLKPSDNLYADSLFLHAAHKLKGAPVNWKEASFLVKQFIQQQTGIDMQQAVLIDGSGLSRNDLLTPIQTVGLLQFLYNRFPLSYEYIAALPVSGRDGTLQQRLKKSTQQDLVRAKTGTMKGVASLSGYLFTANTHTLAFAIFINNRLHKHFTGSYRHVIDTLCNYLLQQRPASLIKTKMVSSSERIRYQFNLTQAEQEQRSQIQWRRLENIVKLVFKGQPVTVLYRNDELVLHDNQSDDHQVLVALQTLQKKYPFAIALASKNKPKQLTNSALLWTETSLLPTSVQRIWTLREAIT